MRYAVIILLLSLAACAPAEPDLAQLPTRAQLPTLAPTIDNTIRPLTFWEEARGTLTAADDTDRWRFTAAAGDQIRLRALGAVTLTLRDEAGATLGSGADIQADLPAAATYIVQVSGAPGNYAIGLGYTDRPNPNEATATAPPVTVSIPTPTPAIAGTMLGQLTADAPQTGRFDSAVEQHVYTFDGRAGLFVTLRMSPVSGPVDPVLTLYGPSGEPVALDSDTGGDRAALLRNILLLADGRYSVQTTGGGQPGIYRLEIEESLRPLPLTPTIIVPPSVTPFAPQLTPTLATAVPGNRLEPFVPVIGDLEAPDAVDAYPIYAVEGESLSLGATPLAGAALRPRIELFGIEGELVARGESSGLGAAALIPGWPVTRTGTYTAFVTSVDGTTGGYQIGYGTGGARENVLRGPALADEPYDGQIAALALRDVWYLSLNAGDVISIAVSPLGTALDPVIELVAPDGSVLVRDDNSGGFPNALIDAVTIPVTGPYRLRVQAVDAASSGPYRLIWRYIDIAPTPTPDPPRALLLSIDETVPEGEYRFFPFQGRGGQRVRVSVIGAGQLDPVAALLGPAGAVLAAADDTFGTLDPVFTATIPADGTYTVRVNGYLTGGPFTLRVELLF